MELTKSAVRLEILYKDFIRQRILINFVSMMFYAYMLRLPIPLSLIYSLFTYVNLLNLGLS